jgi:hypothetical protein
MTHKDVLRSMAESGSSWLPLPLSVGLLPSLLSDRCGRRS